jgi:serine/threonine protein kinase
MFCASCGAQMSPAAKFCATCGAAVDLDTGATIVGSMPAAGCDETIAASVVPPVAQPPRKAPSAPSGSQRVTRVASGTNPLMSSDPIGGGRFSPGLILAERYRIVALLGRGGMGEVYRAEDLKLSQVVAIKFLPEALSQDLAVLQRFHSEVRIARQVSHPNVCRVFDIGDADGIPFLTMEYVAGEDLASLVRRIGRLSPDKATEIARQICAGLAAAHERGVIHRDLKPANVMLDEAGKVRVTDFGLAAIAANISGAEVRAGTPAYMAPEQLAGKEVTTKSDIYSLGLVLYEILTGKRAFDATTLPELMRARQGALPSPSTLVRDLDPLLERVVLRCLEREPSQRPVSALQVAAALPGGDPMAAALAAGETPSPEMVAAAGETEGLKPQFAALCLLGVLAAVLAVFAISSRVKLISMLPLRDSPEVLASKAHDMIARFGYTDPASDSASFFTLSNTYLRYIQETQKTPTRWNVLRDDEPSAIRFWYRESPRLLTPSTPVDNLIYGRVTTEQPAMNISGMTLVGLSPNGRLLYFEAVPPQVDEARSPVPVPDWAPLFQSAGLDPAQLKPVDPRWFPLAWGDTRAAWETAWPQHPGTPLRIEAAAYRGKAIYFNLISQWDKPERMGQSANARQNRVGQVFSIVLLLVILAGGIWIAARNVRMGRGDFPGAMRLALFVLIIGLLDWALLAHHVASAFEYVLAVLAVSVSLFFAGITWLLYVAIEPYVRRYWPNTIISWVRMLKGQFRDPVLGRDILIGTLIGAATAIFEQVQPLIEAAFRLPPSRPAGFTIYSLEGWRGSLANIFYQATQSLTSALLIFFVFFLVRRAVGRTWLAAIVATLLFSLPALGEEHAFVESIFTVPVVLIFFVILHRFGLLALAAFFFADQLASNMPITTPLSAWYAEGGIIGAAAILLVAFYGFQVARAGKPLFGASILDA